MAFIRLKDFVKVFPANVEDVKIFVYDPKGYDTAAAAQKDSALVEVAKEIYGARDRLEDIIDLMASITFIVGSELEVVVKLDDELAETGFRKLCKINDGVAEKLIALKQQAVGPGQEEILDQILANIQGKKV